jgi:hypothetical protein
MKYISIIVALLSLLRGHPIMAQSVPANPALSRLLDSLAAEDQKPYQSGLYKDHPEEASKVFKATTARHIPILKDIIKRYGYPGYDLVGKKSGDHFWLMVQHSDADLAFQKEVLPLMEKQVQHKNAGGSNYAYLVDRILVNKGNKQLYGTQITYRSNICQAYPKPLQDSLNVNVRRKEVGMEPIEAYLNVSTKVHFEMNKASLEKRGITQPTLYTVPEDISSGINKRLADSLHTMKLTDQIAANVRSGQYKDWSPEAWQAFKDSVFGSHQKILEGIFNRYGFPGYDLVGKDGSQDFWLMVQHCDKWPAFQERVLTAMKPQVLKGNANPSNYAYLVDRVMLNTNRKQVYGSQVTYNLDSCQALPKSLADSSTVNARRKEMGLEPIEDYLNSMGSMHFQMNKEFYEKKGITKPKLYAIKP